MDEHFVVSSSSLHGTVEGICVDQGRPFQGGKNKSFVVSRGFTLQLLIQMLSVGVEKGFGDIRTLSKGSLGQDVDYSFIISSLKGKR